MTFRLKVVVFLCLCLAPCVLAAGREVRFEDELAANSGSPIIVIQIPADTVLVFDKGPYFLDGRDLLLYASHVEVRGGAVAVSSWDPSIFEPAPAGVPATPATPGDCGSRRCTGNPGTKGNPGSRGQTGSAGSLIYLDVENFTAETGASLSIASNGQTGAKGGRGGNGGKGGTGGRGDDGSDNNFCERPCPTSGGRGGVGGTAGAGGPGGDGGNGGTIKLSATLKSLHDTGSTIFQAVAPGGQGGPGGDAGGAGVGGDGGDRGAGAQVCICNDTPGPGPQGPPGSTAADVPAPSVPGTPGTIVPLT